MQTLITSVADAWRLNLAEVDDRLLVYRLYLRGEMRCDPAAVLHRYCEAVRRVSEAEAFMAANGIPFRKQGRENESFS